MGEYEKNQIQEVLNTSIDGYYKLKVTGSNKNTNWFNITTYQLKEIQKILK